jgi:hypothetical protein
VATGFAANLAGEVFVTSYYDAGSHHTYTPVSSGAEVGLNYLTSEHDYLILSGVPEFYFGGGYYEADVGSYSRYDFNYYYANGSGDYYVGYVYAPTAFQTSGPNLTNGTQIYDQPMALWGSYKSLNGGYYSITAITDGFAATYDKQSYITSYYDSDTAGSVLGVNSDGSNIASPLYVADRTAAWESGYALSGANHAAFSPYTEADVTLAAASPVWSSTAPAPIAAGVSAVPTQATWNAYWSQTAYLLEEEKYR